MVGLGRRRSFDGTETEKYVTVNTLISATAKVCWLRTTSWIREGFPELSLNAVGDPESADKPHPQSAPTESGARLGSIL